MWIEQRGRQHRVYFRPGLASPKKAFEKFITRDDAERFIELAQLITLGGARRAIADPTGEVLRALLGLPTASVASPATSLALAAPAAQTPCATAHPVNDPRLVGVTFADLWTRYMREQRHLEEDTRDLYESYFKWHFKDFFADGDLGVIARTMPLRRSDALPDTVYVDDHRLSHDGLRFSIATTSGAS